MTIRARCSISRGILEQVLFQPLPFFLNRRNAEQICNKPTKQGVLDCSRIPNEIEQLLFGTGKIPRSAVPQGLRARMEQS
jgi:hypothetical protein